jgi:hypothetical protein
MYGLVQLEEPQSRQEMLDRAKARKRRLFGEPEPTRFAVRPEPVIRKVLRPETEAKPAEIAFFVAMMAVMSRAYMADIKLAGQSPARVSTEDEPPKATKITIEKIQQAVCFYYGVARVGVVSARRHKLVVRPRQVAMYLAREMTPRSMPEIGRRFGGRDHTTVLHAVRKIEGMMLSDADLCQEVAEVATHLGGETWWDT